MKSTENFNEIEAVKSEGKLRLIHSTVYGGLEDPVSPQTALKKYPAEFRALFIEMKKLIDQDNVVKEKLWNS